MPKGAKYGGRKKGTPNKNTLPIRNAISAALEANAERLSEEIAKLKGKDLIEAYNKLADFAIPRLNRTTLTGDSEQPITIQVHKTYEANPEADESD